MQWSENSFPEADFVGVSDPSTMIGRFEMEATSKQKAVRKKHLLKNFGSRDRVIGNIIWDQLEPLYKPSGVRNAVYLHIHVLHLDVYYLCGL